MIRSSKAPSFDFAPKARYPNGDHGPGPRFRGALEIDFAACQLEGACVEACPTEAIRLDRNADGATLRVDLGPCVFCGLCEEACGSGAIKHGSEYELAVTGRIDLVSTGAFSSGPAPRPESRTIESSPRPVRRTLSILHFDAGDCGGCAQEVLSLSGVVHDLSRLGFTVVDDPHRADLLLVTGPIPAGVAPALRQTWEAMPRPRLVVATGACAIDGGVYAVASRADRGLSAHVPVDVFIPGCPPRPQALLHGLLVATGRARPAHPATHWHQSENT